MWVRTEYSSGLAIERKFNVGRVAVIELAHGAWIPDALVGQPRFALHRDGVRFLADFLKLANARAEAPPAGSLVDTNVHARLRSDALRLRSLTRNHSWVEVSSHEGLKLGNARLQRILASSALDFEALDRLWFELTTSNGPLTQRAVATLVATGEIEAQAYCTALYEQLGARPEAARHIAKSRHRYTIAGSDQLFDPLAELLRSPEHRQSAARIHAVVLDCVRETMEAGMVEICRAFADDMLVAESAGRARERRSERYYAWLRESQRGWVGRHLLGPWRRGLRRLLGRA
jgi:hypothetical protein